MLRPTSIPSDDNVRDSLGNATSPTSRPSMRQRGPAAGAFGCDRDTEHAATLRDRLLRHDRRVRVEIVVVEAQADRLSRTTRSHRCPCLD